jgi:hypothetical protein
MTYADEILVITRDRRYTRRDLTHDNLETMRREFYGITPRGELTKKPTSWRAATDLLQAKRTLPDPWGTYFR